MINLSDYNFKEYDWDNDPENTPEDPNYLCYKCRCVNCMTLYIAIGQTTAYKDSGKNISYFENSSSNYSLFIRDKYNRSISEEDLNNIICNSKIINKTLSFDYGDWYVILNKDNVLKVLDYVFAEKADHVSNVIKESSSDITDASNEPCSVCGAYDKYNARSARTNNQVRCYQHC